MRDDLEVIADQVIADRSYAVSIDPGILREIIRRLSLERSYIRSLSESMAADEGLWFVAQTAAEAYLQQELRSFCAEIEGKPTDGAPADPAKVRTI